MLVHKDGKDGKYSKYGKYGKYCKYGKHGYPCISTAAWAWTSIHEVFGKRSEPLANMANFVRAGNSLIRNKWLVLAISLLRKIAKLVKYLQILRLLIWPSRTGSLFGVLPQLS
jgi:hypothetical protein